MAAAIRLTNSSPRANDGGNANKFLSFCLGKEEFGLEILTVREIIGITDITPLPQAPKYVKGVINLRGKIISVVELRTKFGMDSVPYTEETCVIVVEVAGTGGSDSFQMGIIVDSVREVVNIDQNSIEPPPTFGTEISLDYILGMGKLKERVIILLNVAKVLSASELDALASATHAAPSVAGDIQSVQKAA
jgi:purine-binding chemotaxis protein CheW